MGPCDGSLRRLRPFVPLSNPKGPQLFLIELTLQLQAYRSKLQPGLFPAWLLVLATPPRALATRHACFRSRTHEAAGLRSAVGPSVHRPRIMTAMQAVGATSETGSAHCNETWRGSSGGSPSRPSSGYRSSAPIESESALLVLMRV